MLWQIICPIAGMLGISRLGYQLYKMIPTKETSRYFTTVCRKYTEKESKPIFQAICAYKL